MLRNSFVNVVQGIGSTSNTTPVVPESNDGDGVLRVDNTSIPPPIHTTVQQDDSDSPQYNHNLIDNNFHPLYLHNNDHPGLILIAKKLLGPDNYGPWSRSMQIALNARNKFVIINGSFEKPTSSSHLCAQWERVNDMIITWILNTVSDDISDGLSYVTTAQEIWNELRERFSGTNGHRIYQILKDIHALEQGNNSVEVYFHKLKGLWYEYTVLEPVVNCVCGAHKVQVERDQKKKLLQFLMGLHESNATIRGQILMMNPLPSVS